MRVVVTGASGFIGRHLCAQLEDHNFDVVRAVRHSSPNVDGHEYVTGDIADSTVLDELVRGADVVVHLAGRAHFARDVERSEELFAKANVVAASRLAEVAANAGVRRFVFLSSIGVLGDRSEQPLDENAPPAPAEPYARSKLAAEEALSRIAGTSGLELVVLRPALVYGPLCPGNMARLAKLVRTQVPLPLAAYGNVRSLLGVHNLVSLIELAITRPEAANQVFVAADAQEVTLPQLLQTLGEGLGVAVRLVRLPATVVEGLATIAGQRKPLLKLTASLRVDASKARKLLGWVPSVDTSTGLREAGSSFSRQANLH